MGTKSHCHPTGRLLGAVPSGPAPRCSGHAPQNRKLSYGPKNSASPPSRAPRSRIRARFWAPPPGSGSKQLG